MCATHDEAIHYTVRPKEERRFRCTCGTEHEWRWAHHYAGDWNFIYISCPVCGEGYRKHPLDDELMNYPSYRRAHQIHERRFIRENPIVPYDEDQAFDISAITEEKK